MTKDWGNIEKAKILAIGHDPRLQTSDTIANYCFFADYYFKKVPKIRSEKRKYGLAKSAFEQITYITHNKYNPEEIYFTNLCNESLPRAPKGKTVLIPERKAKKGLDNIMCILRKTEIDYVFPMSLQVNYWLQKLGFYDSENGFIEKSEPKEKGLKSKSPYYESKERKSFTLICGNIYSNGKKCLIIPILHPKNFPINKKFETYQECYNRIRKYFKLINITAQQR